MQYNFVFAAIFILTVVTL